MQEMQSTIVGNVATDVRHVETDAGVHIATFRVASTPRRRDRDKGWVDDDTSYVTVTCWRFLAQNVAASLRKGNPVVISGPTRVRQWEKDGRVGHTTEVDARFVGHDLNRGVTSFERVVRTRTISADEDAAARLATGIDGAVDGEPGEGVDRATGEIYAKEDAA